MTFLFLLLGLLLSVPSALDGTWWIRPDLPFEAPALPFPSRFQFLVVLISAAAAAVALGWTKFRDQVVRTVEDPGADNFSWMLWLLAYSAIAALLRLLQGESGIEAVETHFVAATILTLAAIVSWCLAAMPLSFWLRWSRHAPVALSGSVGVIAFIGYHYTERVIGFLEPLHRPTLWLVYVLLRLIREEVVFEPQTFLIGTPKFSVYVDSACAGWEGIGLFLVFFGAYLCVFRRELRFPQVLALLPLGIAALWLLNAIRIVLLILLGCWFSSVAAQGFHSVAGWFFFNAVTLLLVIASQCSGVFIKIQDARVLSSYSNPAAPYLMPLMAIILTAMVARVFFQGFDMLYPLRVIAGAAAIWFCRRAIVFSQWRVSWPAVALGVVAFVSWIALQPKSNGVMDTSFQAALAGLPVIATAGWLLFRVAGAVLLSPVAEELAFRGYALRKLISTDFESVSLRRFTWLSFVGSSVLFGVMHSQWLAGTVAGMIFAIAVYRRGLLSDAVIAHATANSLLSAYVLATGHWSLWA